MYLYIFCPPMTNAIHKLRKKTIFLKWEVLTKKLLHPLKGSFATIKNSNCKLQTAHKNCNRPKKNGGEKKFFPQMIEVLMKKLLHPVWPVLKGSFAGHSGKLGLLQILGIGWRAASKHVSSYRRSEKQVLKNANFTKKKYCKALVAGYSGRRRQK